MKWTGLNDLRESYLKFFESKGHTRMSSFPLVPQDDASLLLINSGMAPLKKYFLGQATPPNTKLTTCQKCIRTPDIENIGKTARHGTYFEMLGNFSFGDYFKNEAIPWAWEFLTEVLEIPREKLWISIYLDDDEAFEIWNKKVGIPADRIVRLGKEDNFREHGTGPCGPCSEIYFDRGEEYGCGSESCGVGCDCDRYMEIWNLVFSQFDSDGKGTYTPFEHPNIDTGMGLERLACVMQGVGNLFEVDTVQNIMSHISQIAGVTYHTDKKSDVSLRVITDHIRSTVFMVGDGVTPSNEGRGYVLRRLLRRAARHGRLLGINEPFLYKVAATVVKENQPEYSDLVRNQDYITKIIKVEEERFAKTIDQGMDLLSELIAEHEAQGKTVLDGADAFRLYDTFGFPIDLTIEIIAEKGMTVDEEEFTKLMKEQRVRARAARGASEAFGSGENDPFAGLQEANEHFKGYGCTKADSKVLVLVHEGERADTLIAGQEAVVVLENTPFYAESGGQVGDTGLLLWDGGSFKVTDTKKLPSGHFAHIGRMNEGQLNDGDTVTAQVDEQRRASIMRNHSACHLLQAALRKVLGDHVHQAGSLVDEHRCRFDFSHFSAMTAEEIRATEALVNEMVFAALPVNVSEMGIEDAKASGAMALFGEKYGDVVRVCKMGEASTELCGGTHVSNTAQVGLFKIVSESSAAANVRRIEAVTGKGVLEMIDRLNGTIGFVAEQLKVSNPSEVEAKMTAYVNENKEREKELESVKAKMAASQIEESLKNAIAVGSVRFVAAGFAGAAPDTLRMMADVIKEKAEDMVAVLTAVNGEKASIMVVCGAQAVKAGVHAGKMVKQLTALCGGSGGGRPDSAMGGATEIFKIDEAVAQAPEMIKAMLK
ncbi:MAG: alanine--tRNA ligase [Oscillospiraceae bacterium]|nr:alanine--tRNA ligase [Oscillospiraceae bacterium]